MIIVICVVLLYAVALIFEPLIYRFCTFCLGFDNSKTNINLYISEEYKKYDGGKEAGELFPAYDELSNYSDIKFSYENNANFVYYGKLPDFFALDVQYDEDTYNKELEKAENNNISTRDIGQYSMFIEEMCENGTKCICFNEVTHTIRYMYIHNYKLETSANTIIYRNSGLDWCPESKIVDLPSTAE